MQASTLFANQFLENKEIAIVGVSRDKKKFGFKIFDLLRSNGYIVYPIHYKAKEIDGVQCYKSFLEVPESVKNLYVVTPKHITDQVIESSLSKKFKMVWFQQKSETNAALETIIANGSTVISNKCMFMFVEPKGGHAFHKKIFKFLGKI